MADVSHTYGNDILTSATGDIAIADGVVLGQQRVLRRLLTNPGDYIWQPTYGAGLGQFVGQPLNADLIASVIRSQMFLEAVVAQTPAPQITATPSTTGYCYVSIIYTDAASNTTQQLGFSL